MFFPAIKAMASNTIAVGAIDHTVEPFRARIPLIVPAILMFYLRPAEEGFKNNLGTCEEGAERGGSADE
jgi:hypothetical protein